MIDNLLKRTQGSAELTEYVPQDDFLKLLMLGDGTAIGFRFGMALKGRWVWHLKDAIDSSFMDLFRAEFLPDLSAVDSGSKPDTSQYDANTGEDDSSEIMEMSPVQACDQLVRTDDEVSYQTNWALIKRMMKDIAFKEMVVAEYERRL
jgi:selenide,water dikinase